MDAEFVEYVLSMIVTFGLTYAILRFDEARLSEVQLERCWPQSSRNSAILAFSPLCLLVHFTRTRWSLVGFLMGVAAMFSVVAVDYAMALGVDVIMSR